MFDRRQYDLIRSLCLAGVKGPEANFALCRELIAIGERAEAEIAVLDREAQDAAVLATADQIKAQQEASRGRVPGGGGHAHGDIEL